MNEDLTALSMMREEFPAYRIWQEVCAGQVRYVARSRYQGLSPHTIITPDPAELRQALDDVPVAGPDELAAFSAAQPNIARMYDYWLDGKDNYAADRVAAASIMEEFPEVAAIAQANRAFVGRAVRHAAQKGITQFIDVGCGLPASPNVHEIARAIWPAARVVYIDRDPVVLAHARALLARSADVSVVAGDIRDTASLLADPVLAGIIDKAKPVCVLLTSVLHFLPAADADAVAAAFREWMPPGSHLVISAGTSTGTDPGLIHRLESAYGDTTPVTGRTATDIRAWFDGLTLEAPGLANVWAWRPEHPTPRAFSRAMFLAAVGRKPAPLF